MYNYFVITISNIIICFCSFSMFYLFINYFFNKKVNKIYFTTIALIAAVIYSVGFTYLLEFFMNDETRTINSIGYYISDVFAYILNFIFVFIATKQVNYKALIYSLFIAISFSLATVFEGAILIVLEDLLNSISSMPYKVLFACIMEIISIGLVFLIVYKLKMKEQIDSIIHSKNKNTIVFVPIILTIVSLIAKLLSESDDVSMGVISMLIVSIFFIVVSYTSSHYKSMEIIQSKEALILQQTEYLNTLEDIQHDIKSFQHDYKNTISALYLHAEEGNLDFIQDYLQQTLGIIDNSLTSKIKQTSNLANIKILELKSLLLIKTMMIEKAKINYQIEAINPIEKVNIEISDLIVALGILIDNAFEASDINDTIKISFINDDNLSIIVSNPCREKVHLSSIYKKGESSKGENRGLGLFNYQKIIDNYDNLFKETRVENNNFIQILTIS